jgi:hypothetical protein
MKPMPILAGEPIVVAVEGGVRRKPAPCDGLDTDAGFLPLRDLELAMVELRERQEKRPTQRWRPKRRAR